MAHTPLRFFHPQVKDITLDCRKLTVSIERRLQRTVLRGGEGDDLQDEGAESAQYDIEATISKDEYRVFLAMFRGTQPTMREPFEDDVIKVAFKSMSYNAETSTLCCTIIQDIN